MGYRIQGIVEQLDARLPGTNATELGQLVAFDGTADTFLSSTDNTLPHYPLNCPFDPTKDTQAPVQITGVAKIYVEDEAGIALGTKLIAGPLGIGVIALPAVPVGDEHIIGEALETPADVGDTVAAKLY